MPAARFVVSGKVQGVFFRAATRERATALGLDGYARNLPDGRVEVLASGPHDAVESLAAWLWTGSAPSRVDDVAREAAAPPSQRGFDVG
ncbi:MAG TPA: acylphosphatase [Candidatus Saccharimonadia bacterium]|nr:acylphosphatase [Candidatus Saccharimonadia bacterium]